MTVRRTGIVSYLLWSAAFIAATFATHWIYSIWPWPQEPHGTAPLQHALASERVIAQSLLEGTPYLAAVGATMRWTYTLLFEYTGMDFLLRLAATSTPLSGFDETLRRLAIGMWSFMESVYWSVQLIGLRLGMLITNLPFALLMALAGTVDGLASRYVRTTSAGRESGFIYHRAKLTLWLLSLGLVAVYLMPPVTMDPRYVFPAFTVLVFIAVRVAAAWFKKYV